MLLKVLSLATFQLKIDNTEESKFNNAYESLRYAVNNFIN